MTKPDWSNIAAGVLVAAIGGFVASSFQAGRDNATQSAQIADSKECRTQLIEARNRENALRDEMHRRDIDDLRTRIGPLEHPKR